MVRDHHCHCHSVVPAHEALVTKVPYPEPCIMQLLGSILVLRGHPRPMRPTPSFEYSTMFVAVAFGMGAALTHSYSKVAHLTIPVSRLTVPVTQQFLRACTIPLFMGASSVIWWSIQPTCSSRNCSTDHVGAGSAAGRLQRASAQVVGGRGLVAGTAATCSR